MRFKRDTTTGTTTPSFIWNIGPGAGNDFITFTNEGKTIFENEMTINSDLNVFGHKYSINGIETDKSVYSIYLNQDSETGFKIM